MASLKQKCEVLAARLGATITSGPRGNEVCVEAPRGYVWGGGVHELVNSPWDGERRSVLWRAALAAMEEGLAPCTDEECEWCASGVPIDK